MKQFLSLLILLLLTFTLKAQVVYQGTKLDDIGTLVEYSYPPHQNGAWLQGDRENLNLSMLKDNFKVRIPFQNNSTDSMVIMTVDNPFFDTIQVSMVGSELLFETGDNLQFETRPKRFRNFAFPLRIAPGESQIVELDIRSRTSSFLPISFMNQEAFEEKVMFDYLWFGVLYGVMLIMLLYNLFIYGVLKKNSYLWYSAFVGVNILLYMAIEGHAKQFLFREASDWANRFVPFIIGAVNPLIAQFTLSFLGRKSVGSRTKKALHIISIWGVLVTLGSLFLPLSLMNRVSQVSSLFTIFYLMVTGIVYWRRGNKSAVYFVAAFFIYLIGAMNLVLRNLGYIEVGFFTNHLMEIGSLLEVSLLSVALADRFKRMEQEKQLAQKELLVFQKNQNEKLEAKVQERTAALRTANDEIVTQNEELKQLTEEIGAQRDALSQHNLIIEKKQQDIDSSINYARRIQRAILPDAASLEEMLGVYSVLYKPKQVVSGDFYYVTRAGGKTFAAVVDCTGHGVPGAIMSMIGHSALERAIHGRKIHETGKILDKVHQIVSESLNQRKGSNSDGMDMVLVSFDPQQDKLEVSGAKNPAFIQRGNSEIELIKGDRMPIGGQERDQNFQFTTHSISLEKEETIKVFLSSDGYQDQFGGERGRKLGRKNLISLLASISGVEEVAGALDEYLENWRSQANEKQLDDICLLAFEFSPAKAIEVRSSQSVQSQYQKAT